MSEKSSKIKPEEKIECGIIMPIASMDGISASHWEDVKSIIQDSLAGAFDAEMVSISSATDIIHKTIIQNLAEKPIVVCDVSCKNANVMFELGMRLAFNMPVVIIKDDKTDYTFDAGIIEHLEYPRDLRHNRIEDFKASLAKKVRETHSRSLRKDAPKFLDNFGKITVASLDTTNVDLDDYVKTGFQEIHRQLSAIDRSLSFQINLAHENSNESINLPARFKTHLRIKKRQKAEFLRFADTFYHKISLGVHKSTADGYEYLINGSPPDVTVFVNQWLALQTKEAPNVEPQ